MNNQRISVLFETEGTYPFSGGGVSVWSDILCQELEEVDYHIIAVTGSRNVSLKFNIPPNVKKIITIPLWGIEDPIDYVKLKVDFKDIIKRKKSTSTKIIKQKFVPLFKNLIRVILNNDPINVTSAILILHLYNFFQEFDYKTTFQSFTVWDAFRYEVHSYYKNNISNFAEYPHISDLTTSLRMLYHHLIPIGVPIPKTDITHTSIAGFCGLAGVISKFQYNTPMIVTDHGVFIRERYIAISSSKFSFFLKKFLIHLSTFVSKICYAMADQISPVCNFNKKWEIALGASEEKIQTIYNGIDPLEFVPKEKPQHTKDRPTVVAAAHIIRLKDILTMIRSCHLVRKVIPNIQYLVYGSLEVDTDYTNECIKLINEMQLTDHFFLAGFHPMKSQLYNTGDISILTSISEGFPYTVIESMACARPVVATDVGGVKEAIGDHGILVKPRDAQEIAHGVIKLLSEPDLCEQIGREARERILLNFRISDSVKDYHSSYLKLIDSNLSRRRYKINFHKT